MDEDPGRQPIPTSERQHRPLPQGYRQGIITAITVLLGCARWRGIMTPNTGCNGRPLRDSPLKPSAMPSTRICPI